MVINVQDDILRLHAMGLLDRLLQDKATKGNILWATDAYSQYGEFYSPGNEIRSNRITGECSDLIKTRARRAMEQRTERTRQHAEVFTPFWVVKKMNDFADERWFDRKSGIYKLTEDGKICFGRKKHWKRYVDARRLEITCGEAPFLATRYETETGEAIPIADRIGLLDRKLRVVTENAQNLEEWKTWALRAVQSIYGYELQGDNLLIARVNILFTVEEHLFYRWKQKPEKPWLEKLCNVIVWNLWQMDGIRGCVPVPPAPTEEQLSLFPPIDEQTNLFGEMEIKDIPCRLFDWRGDHSISYSALRKKGSELMKFDFIIGNPPYQEPAPGGSTSDKPIYHLFMEESYKIGDCVELITPARFLFNAGGTPKEWNKQMLENVHLKVLFYEPDANRIFNNIVFTGGVAVTSYDAKKATTPIGIFIPYQELNSIRNKVVSSREFVPVSSIVSGRTPYLFTDIFHKDHPEAAAQLSKGHLFDISSNAFESLPDVFLKETPSHPEEYYRVLGRLANQRTYLWLQKKYARGRIEEYTTKWKVFLPKANGASGMLGTEPARLISKPEVGSPEEIATDTFLCVGAFNTSREAKNLLKFIVSKFARVLLGSLKVTQINAKETWKNVPLQDFTSASDIDWSKSIPEIDRQLYRKYGLDNAEIEFIESHVKEMS